MEFDYTIETDEGEIIELEVSYEVFGSHIPATRLEPEEFPEIDDIKAVNTETGEVVELSQAEYDEVSIKCEEHLSEWEEDDNVDRSIYLH